MNLLEHYIEEVHFVTDVTNKLAYPTSEPLYAVDLTYDCHGQIKRETRYFFQTEWEVAKLKGYFMA